ncbi:DUF1120 domain-containing protein, partial [Burkholderia sp. BE17]|uniref:DUF1120 domain-containing protein n=1 Tax=Burkholderia sp. BE17 TaxID=2656644 RepID=UPI00128D50DA
MRLKQLFVLSVLASALSSPGVTSAADLGVNGRIREDDACGIALGNGGVIDLGNLSRKDVPTSSTIVGDMPLTINCQRPTRVGVNMIDNREGTTSPGAIGSALGLGNPAIGHYVIFSDDHKADGRRVYPIARVKGGTGWWGEEG